MGKSRTSRVVLGVAMFLYWGRPSASDYVEGDGARGQSSCRARIECDGVDVATDDSVTV